ncbi:hypothetical protein UlMin_041799 [Ulmus minor]
MASRENSEFGLSPDGILHFKGRLCIPNDPEMRNQILSEAHSTPYSVHPGTSKMYKDLRGHFWWPGMKKDVVEFISKCLTCQKVKAEHQRPGGELQPIEIPEWNYQATIGAAPYEALYGRKCRSPVHWYEVGESLVVAPDFVEATTEAIKKIRARMETAQSRQKSYADKRRRPLEFQEGDFVFLKLAPFKGVIRFGRRGKLNPRFIGHYKIL